jgi:molybdopterin converting factor small subunit
MRVKVVYLGLVRSRIGKDEEQCEVANGSSLADLIKILAENYGERLQSIVGERRESRLDPTFITTVNGILKDPLQANNVSLKDGDIVTFMTLISGG